MIQNTTLTDSHIETREGVVTIKGLSVVDNALVNVE